MQAKNRPIPKPENPNDLLDNFQSFYEIVKILRQDCPWDSTQTNESIAHLMIEETYEAIDAIHKNNYKEFADELGDILLHIVMHAVMAEEKHEFNMIDIIQAISKKMVHRHPHVFGDTNINSTEDVLQNWEALKKKEGKKSTLEGVPLNLPALLRAERIQHKASKVGFDWDNKDDVWKKVEEELGELKTELNKGDKDKSTREFGDFLFALVNAARFEDIVPEEALQFTNEKFTQRFQYIEAKAKEMGKDMKQMTLQEMDDLWNEAKKTE